MYVSASLVCLLLIGFSAACNVSNSEGGCWEDAAANFVQLKSRAHSVLKDERHNQTEHLFEKEMLAPNQPANCAPVWEFMTNANTDLVGILKGPVTGTKKTEVHIASASSNYAKYTLQTGTPLGLTSGGGADWQFVMSRSGDLYGILKGPVTGSKKTELHVLSAASNYQKFILQIGTAMGYSSGGSWDFALKPNKDLVGILKGPVTGSKKTEVHILSAASNYQKFSVQSPTAYGYTNSANWAWQVANNGDLVGILKGPQTGSKKTEIHSVSQASNYQKYTKQVGTSIGISGNNWAFFCRMNRNCDLVGVLKGPLTGSKKTEIHAVTAASNYQTYFKQVPTAFEYSITICKKPPPTSAPAPPPPPPPPPSGGKKAGKKGKKGKKGGGGKPVVQPTPAVQPGIQPTPAVQPGIQPTPAPGPAAFQYEWFHADCSGGNANIKQVKADNPAAQAQCDARAGCVGWSMKLGTQVRMLRSKHCKALDTGKWIYFMKAK